MTCGLGHARHLLRGGLFVLGPRVLQEDFGSVLAEPVVDGDGVAELRVLFALAVRGPEGPGEHGWGVGGQVREVGVEGGEEFVFVAGCHVADWCLLQQVLGHLVGVDEVEGRVLDARQVGEGICAVQDGVEFGFHGFEGGGRDLAAVEILFGFFEGGAGAFDLRGAVWGEVGFEGWDGGSVWGWGAEVIA